MSKKKLKYFNYNQNNSGGSFISDDSVDHNVIIQAEDIESANKKAKEIGIYFNGCDDGKDCSCCGDRWYEASGEGDNKPLVYGEPANKYKDMWGLGVIVYHADGTKDHFKSKKGKG